MAGRGIWPFSRRDTRYSLIFQVGYGIAKVLRDGGLSNFQRRDTGITYVFSAGCGTPKNVSGILYLNQTIYTQGGGGATGPSVVMKPKVFTVHIFDLAGCEIRSYFVSGMQNKGCTPSGLPFKR